jgi:hypothetical protein
MAIVRSDQSSQEKFNCLLMKLFNLEGVLPLSITANADSDTYEKYDLIIRFFYVQYFPLSNELTLLHTTQNEKGRASTEQKASQLETPELGVSALFKQLPANTVALDNKLTVKNAPVFLSHFSIFLSDKFKKSERQLRECALIFQDCPEEYSFRILLEWLPFITHSKMSAGVAAIVCDFLGTTAQAFEIQADELKTAANRRKME